MGHCLPHSYIWKRVMDYAKGRWTEGGRLWDVVLRIPWTERKTNAWVLEKIGNRLMLREMVRRRKMRFYVIRRKGLERTIITGKVNGKRKRDGPPTSWLKDIKSSTGIIISLSFYSASYKSLCGWHCKRLWEQQRIGRDGEESWKPQHRTTRYLTEEREREFHVTVVIFFTDSWT